MAQIYGEKLVQKADYRQALIESRDRWKLMDVDERTARAESNEFTEKSTCMAWQHDNKKARLERNHQLTKIKQKKKVEILLELIKSNKPKDEMELMLLMD